MSDESSGYSYYQAVDVTVQSQSETEDSLRMNIYQDSNGVYTIEREFQGQIDIHETDSDLEFYANQLLFYVDLLLVKDTDLEVTVEKDEIEFVPDSIHRSTDY